MKKFEWNENLIKKCINENKFYLLNAFDKNDHTALIWCCGIDNKNIELIDQLLNNHNIIVDKKNNTGLTAFINACVCQPKAVIKMLKRNDIDFNFQDSEGNTGFMWACLNQPSLVSIMLEDKKIDKLLVNNDKETAFDLAKEYNLESYRIYKSFIENNELNNSFIHVVKKSKSIL